MTRAAPAGQRPPPTVSHILGELTWLPTQSERHQSLPIAELTWLLMPAISHRQFHMFYEGEKPVAAVTWAMLDEENERKYNEGRFRPPSANEADWRSGDRRWLIDFISPFANDANKQDDIIFADLVTGVFKGLSFKMLRIDPSSNVPQVIAIDNDFGARLTERAAATLSHTR